MNVFFPLQQRIPWSDVKESPMLWSYITLTQWSWVLQNDLSLQQWGGLYEPEWSAVAATAWDDESDCFIIGEFGCCCHRDSGHLYQEPRNTEWYSFASYEQVMLNSGESDSCGLIFCMNQ